MSEQSKSLALTEPAFTGQAADLAGPNRDADEAVWRKVHQTIKRATDAMERDFGFNTAIAACMELVNEVKVDRLSPAVARLAVETLIQLLAPMAPHICAELWAIFSPERGSELGNAELPWPSLNEAALKADTVTYPVQVNGKVRGRVSVAADADQAAILAAALADEGVQAQIAGKTLVKQMAVPGKIVVLVAK